jgi:hypothetical protein
MQTCQSKHSPSARIVTKVMKLMTLFDQIIAGLSRGLQFMLVRLVASLNPVNARYCQVTLPVGFGNLVFPFFMDSLNRSRSFPMLE